MTFVNTVLGTLDTSLLGFTLTHEHLMFSLPGIARNYPELLGDTYKNSIISTLIEAKKAGINTIIDASTYDIGRDTSLLTEASLRSGVNIITCTGWYCDPLCLTDSASIDRLAQLFIREIRQGIAGTDIKAGILKSAVRSEGMTPGREVILRSVARAHLSTGVPILLHSSAPEQVGRQQIAILKEEGVNLRRVKIDHCLDSTDIKYLVWLLEQGCYLGMDPFPGLTVSVQERVRTVKRLIDSGWAHRLLLSHDHIMAMASPDIPFEIKREVDGKNPHGLSYITKIVLPQLKEMGVMDTVINTLFIKNPRNFFEGV